MAPDTGATPEGALSAEPIVRPFSSGTHVGGYAVFSEIPGVLLGLNHDALILAGGFTFKYDGNGIPDPLTGRATADRLSAGFTVGGSYLMYNRYPMGIGPGFGYSTSLAPSMFGTHQLTPSVAFFYAPFAAPLALVAVISGRLVLESGREPTFEIITPSILVGYLIR